MAPVVRTVDGERELIQMRWGFPPPPKVGTQPVTNVRNVSSPFWRAWLKPQYRCLVPLTSFTGIMAIVLHRQPPFFSPPFFLALTQVGALFFGGMVAAAIILRRRTEWHRRLMLSATVLVMEPAFGRIIPLPLTGADIGEGTIALLQVAVLGIAMLHDRKYRGAVHPALFWGAGAVIVSHALLSILSRFPPVIAIAESLAG